jgi:predicted DNA-binding transcriptional regulator YafY
MTDRLERLINLVIALRETRRPMTAADIRTRVAGYGQSDPEAFRRMFERDKADLRDLGVPIETAMLDAFDDRPGYRIDPRRYNLPDVRLAPDELAALAVAVQATGLDDEAGPGLLKLQVAVGDPGGDRRSVDPRLGVSLEAPHRETLVGAQLSRTAVRFDYRPMGRKVASRTVDPHALVHRRGRWYLVGRDHDRDDRRAFRLDRIEGKVTTTGPAGAFAPPPPADVDDVVPAPPPGAPQTAEVLVTEDVAWLVARRARGGGAARDDGWVQFTVGVRDPEDFTSWALSLGPDLRVLAPAELRDDIVGRLRALVQP